jgi:hypothetical protein
MNSFDTDVVNSCITGLFSIFSYVTKSKELLCVPFTLKTSLDDKTPNDAAAAAPALIVMHPKEENLGDYILLELSIILDNGSSE